MKSKKDVDSISRRHFLKKASILTGGIITGFPAIVPSRVFGKNAPSNRIAMGCIGLGGMGAFDMKSFLSKSAVDVIALCDVDANHLQAAQQIANVEEKSLYQDFRELLIRDDIDAVTVVTPDHWHVPISIAAVKAGKDVYCEKPLSLTVSEGRILADTVKRYGRVLQTGSQQRSNFRYRTACEWVRNGRIGELHTIRVWIPKNSRECPPKWQTTPVPKGLDYNFWLGPAQWQPYTDQRCHYSFRFIQDYSGGQMTNWGAHDLDIAQWGNNADNTGPTEIYGTGVFPKTGLFNTASHTNIVYRYANGVQVHCKTGGNGVRFEGSEGWIFVQRGKLEAYPKSILSSPILPGEFRLPESNDHAQNFIDCIKSRELPIANAEVGHRSATICHLGNIAMQLGEPLKWNPIAEKFIGNTTANSLLSRPMRSPWRL